MSIQIYDLFNLISKVNHHNKERSYILNKEMCINNRLCYRLKHKAYFRLIAKVREESHKRPLQK